MCVCQPRIFQDTDGWGQKDGRGRPVGSGCYLDMSTAAEAYPKMTFQEVANMFHDKTQGVWKAGFMAAREMKKRLMDGESNTFKPPSSVFHTTVRGVMVYYEHLFVTEAEVLKLTGCGSTSLKLGRPISLPVEDGSYLNGFLISMKGITWEQAAGFRRVQMKVEVINELSEEVLQSCNQIAQNQGADVFAFTCDTQESTMPKSIRPSNRHNVVTLPALLERAQAILEDRSL